MIGYAICMLSWKKNIVKIYIISVALSITLLLVGQYGIFIFSKVFILPSLMYLIFQCYQQSNHKLIPILLVSTFFSFIGDVLIAIKVYEDLFKMISLSSFLVAQAGYSYMFFTSFRFNKDRPNISLKKRWPEFLSLILIVVFTISVAQEMGEFYVLGIIYGMIACASMVLALDRRFYVSFKSYLLVLLGLILFYLSDILAGLDLELTDNFTHVAIILSFAFGHYLIVSGIFLQVKEDTQKTKASDSDASDAFL